MESNSTSRVMEALAILKESTEEFTIGEKSKQSRSRKPKQIKKAAKVRNRTVN
jgi:hypothetical protein